MLEYKDSDLEDAWVPQSSPDRANMYTLEQSALYFCSLDDPNVIEGNVTI